MYPFLNFEPMEGPIQLLFGLYAQNRCMYEVTEGNLETTIFFGTFLIQKLTFFPQKCLFYEQKFYQNMLCGT